MLKLRIFHKEITKRDGTGSFDAYKVENRKNHLSDLKFAKTVTNRPIKDCVIYVKEDNFFKASNTVYPCYWVTKIEKIEEYQPKKRDYSEEFETVDDEDLPY